MNKLDIDDTIKSELQAIESAGEFKTERILMSAQGRYILTNQSRSEVVNLCANNYLGFSNHPSLIEAASAGLQSHGLGLASVRFICGTTDLHIELENSISRFLRFESAILYNSCFDANTGFFETLLGKDDAIISDRLNHASIIDGIRLCKAKRFTYSNNDMQALEDCLKQAKGSRRCVIATDGVFSMDGKIADLESICDLAECYGALVFVDDSHGVGVIGKTGRGSLEYRNVMTRVDFVSGTFGKALGGGCGGFIAGKDSAIALLRQRSRPYLFSNTLAPPIVAATLRALEMLDAKPELIARLRDLTQYFRKHMTERGFEVGGGDHPICPIVLAEASLVAEFAKRLLARGIFVVGFWFPVVPAGQARIRVQISADHTEENLDFAITQFTEVGIELGVISV